MTPIIASPPTGLATVRVGCSLAYVAAVATPVLLMVRPRSGGGVRILEESLSLGIGRAIEDYVDSHGNTVVRMMFAAGRNEIRHDALVSVPLEPDISETDGAMLPISELPAEVLRYTLPSRYCDSDRLMNFAWERFGQVPHGLARVRAICDWVHENISYSFGSGRPDISASEVIARGFGVCRDFAHVAIALCRTFNLPARYVTGHLPDIGYVDPGTPMDFHAYCEVHLGRDWLTFDPRYNVPRIGRIKLAHAADAVGAAFATIYGAATLANFEVWAYQVRAGDVTLGSPIDLTRRLDGTARIRHE